jgi:hypothetical protein
MKKILLILVLGLFAGASFASAQPRIVEKKPEKTQPVTLAAASFKAKYEGGMFGFSEKETGTLKFDGNNHRLVFFGKDNKELFGIPYDAIQVIYPQSKTVQSTGGKVMERVPLPGAGIAGVFMKNKTRYMVINFNDPEVNAKGTVNFKFDSQEMLNSAIQTLGNKAEMQQRGDAFYRPKKTPTTEL